ncbi:MAG: hypothetical protein JHC31_12060 [Sulfurihydrogenibium sp.]|jgi:DNA polymerase III sliding clamp (beta) subunit (PCNA family)|nr:hypothetical protein [Sulfurihydrogenibium sp.]
MEDKITIEGRKFIRGIEKVAYATSKRKESAGKPISGICLSIGGGRIDFVATDIYRLAIYSAKLVKDAVLKRRMYIVPVEAARELANKISKDENLEITVQDNKITFNSPSYSLTCDLIQGKFPSYYKVIPRSFNIELKAPKGKLSEAIRNVVKERLYRSEEVGSYERIKIIPQKNKLVVSTLSSDQPLPTDYKSRVHSIVVETLYNHFGFSDEDTISPHVYLNDMYVRQALNTIEGAKVIIKIINEYSPIAITSPNPEDGYLALIMPINPDNPQEQLALVK